MHISGLAHTISRRLAIIVIVTTIFLLSACTAAEIPPAATSQVEQPAPASPTQPPATELPPPTAPPSQTPLPIEVPTAPPTPAARLLTVPSVTCCRGLPILAGTYKVPDWLELPLSVEIGEGWRVMNEASALLFLIGRGQNVQNNPSQMIVLLKVSDRRTPRGLIEAVQAAPELVTVSAPVTVTVAGFSGLQLDSMALPNPSYAGSAQDDIPPGVQFLPVFRAFFSPGFAWTTSSPEATVRTLALRVDQRTLLFYLEAPTAEFEQFAADAEALLQTLKVIED